MNRRHFVKSSAAIGGTGLLLGSGPLQAMVHNSVNDVIKIAMIGCGGRATGAAIQALSTKQNVQLVAMADAFPDRIDESVKAIKKEIEDSDWTKINLQSLLTKCFRGLMLIKKSFHCVMLSSSLHLRVSDPFILRRLSLKISTCSWRNRWLPMQ